MSISYAAHMIPTVSFFGLAGLSIVLLSIYLFPHDKLMGSLGVLIIIVDIILALYIHPVIQKVAVFLIAFWFFVMAIRMYLYSKHD